MRNTVIKHREGNIGEHGEYTVNTGKHVMEYNRKHMEYRGK